MPALPRATTTVSNQAGAAATGLDVICLFTPCATSADATPRLFGNAAQVYDQHGYCEGVEYAALHAQKVRKPLLVCGLPIVTAGAISREDTSGNSGSCATTLSAGGSGILAEHDGIVKVDHDVGTTVTIGTDQVKLSYSLDGGRTFKPYRLGTANSFPIPYFGATMAFGAGTLKGGETIHTWHGSAPRSDSAGWALARAALAAQQKGFRAIMLIGDVQTHTEALAFNTQLEAYETENERFTRGRVSVYDRLPLARANGNLAYTFVAATPEITRATGSFVTDGFKAGDTFTVTGSASNDGTYTVDSVTALSIVTVEALVNETGVAGDIVIEKVQSKAAWAAELDAEFASVDAKFRIGLGWGRGRVLSPFTGWYMRRPAHWFASLREFAHDLHVATWRKSDGPLAADLFDEGQNLVEWDDRTDGEAASRARFTALRTWANGPVGAFVALDLTRDTEGSLLGARAKVDVINLVCTTVQLNSENAAIGVDLVLNADGTATPESLASIKQQVDRALEKAVLTNLQNEGPRASFAEWVPDASTNFNVAEPVLTSVTNVEFNGTVHSVVNEVAVKTGA